MPKPLKNFILMVLASLTAFMLFSYIDEYENLIAPLFRKKAEARKQEAPDFMSIINGFNDTLSQVYLSGDPSRAAVLHAGDSIKQVIAEEIGFLLGSGKVMELNARNMRIEKVESLSPEVIMVRTTEMVSVKYLNPSDRRVVVPEKAAEYHMIYTLENKKGKWLIVGYETRGVSR